MYIYGSDSQRGAYAPLAGNSIIIEGQYEKYSNLKNFLFYPTWVKLINL